MNGFVEFLIWIASLAAIIWLLPRLAVGVLLGVSYIVDFVKKIFGKENKENKKDDEQWYEYEQYEYHPSTVHYFSEKFR